MNGPIHICSLVAIMFDVSDSIGFESDAKTLEEKFLQKKNIIRLTSSVSIKNRKNKI